MTFHDEVHENMELEAAKAVRTLQLWVSTIASISPSVRGSVLNSLAELIVECEWVVDYDIQLDLDLVNIPEQVILEKEDPYEYDMRTTNRKGYAHWTDWKEWLDEEWEEYDFHRDDFTDNYYYRRLKQNEKDQS